MSGVLSDNIILEVKSTLEKSTTAKHFNKKTFYEHIETGQVNRTGLSCRIGTLDGP